MEYSFADVVDLVFVSHEAFSAFSLGLAFAVIFTFVGLLLSCVPSLLDLLISWLRRKLKLDKGGGSDA